jgi:cysteine rich repeat protein
MFHKIAILFAAAVAGSTVALAQLPLPIPLPMPQGTPEDRAACEPDVQRYCKASVPDQLRVLGCLQDNRKRISQSCQGVLARYGQ